MPEAKIIILASATCIGLGALLCLAPLVPCGYTGAADGLYAGYGNHSLAEITASGLEWDSDAVPVPHEGYSGPGPYSAAARGWALALYAPIFAAIALLGWLVQAGRLTRPSRMSGELPARTPQPRRQR